jgi:hypothetical protein
VRLRGFITAAAVLCGKTAVATGVAPVQGFVERAGACGYGVAPTSPNPDEFWNADHGGAGEYLSLQYDPCTRYTRGKYQGLSHDGGDPYPCSFDGTGCVDLVTHYNDVNVNRTCSTPTGVDHCYTAGKSDAGITSYTYGVYHWYLYDFVGKTGSY